MKQETLELSPTISISIEGRSGAEVKAELKRNIWSKKERRRQAFKVLGLGFVLAIVFAFIPLAHLVLVPLTLLATPFTAWKISEIRGVIPKQSFNCPKCSAAVEFPFSFELEPKSQLQCDACREVLLISI